MRKQHIVAPRNYNCDQKRLWFKGKSEKETVFPFNAQATPT